MPKGLTTNHFAPILYSMQNPAELFIQPRFADEPLSVAFSQWLQALESRPVSKNTLKNYNNVTISFLKSLVLHDSPLTLASLSESAVMSWKADLRAGALANNMGKRNWIRPTQPTSETTIRSYVIILKVFANRWVKRRYSNVDLLDLVELGKEIIEMKEGLSEGERERLLSCLDGNGFEAVRDRAFIQLLLATGCRFKEIHGLTTTTIDLEQKRMWVVLKGGRSVPVDLDGRALRDFRAYMARRRLVAGPNEQAVWVSDGGKPLKYWGAYGLFTRLEERSGVHCNPHRFRHTVAQTAAKGGAPVGDIQDLLHHTSATMSRRYIGDARQDVVAGLAKKWSLAG